MAGAARPTARRWRARVGWLLAVVLGGLFIWHDFGAPVSLGGLLAVLAAGVSLHLVMSLGRGEGGGKWFPGWAGPVLGVYLGLLTAFAVSWKAGQPLMVGWLVGCAAGGLAVGAVMWLLDLVRAAPKTDTPDPAARDAAVAREQT